MPSEIDLGGRKIPVWVFAVGGIGALGLYLYTRGGGAGPSANLASAQSDQAISDLNAQIQALNTAVTALENAGGAGGGTGGVKNATVLTQTQAMSALASSVQTQGGSFGSLYSESYPVAGYPDLTLQRYTDYSGAPTGQVALIKGDINAVTPNYYILPSSIAASIAFAPGRTSGNYQTAVPQSAIPSQWL
jgi:hypothetical protein